MKTIKNIKSFKITAYLTIVLFLGIAKTYGQQDPQYTQYMYNMNIVNPAYAGSKETLSIGLLGRRQWVGIKGGPETLTATVNALVGRRTGFGLSFITDKIGPVKETNAYADYSYTIPVSKKGKLALGIKAGATFHNVNLTDLEANEANDLALSENINRVYPNLGIGGYYYTDKFYAGLSLPNMFTTKHFDSDTGFKTEASEHRHFFLTSGYVFDISDNVRLKPSTMLKGVVGAPLSIDLSVNALLNDKVDVGLSYRLDDSVSAVVGLYVNPDFRIGYSYDYTVSGLSDFNSGSHEIILVYDIRHIRDRVKSPRFF